MEIGDIQKVFTRIKELHPNTPPDKVPTLTQGEAKRWVQALSGYSVDQVLTATESHARSCRFWPALSEILAQLPQISESERRRYTPWTPSELRSFEKSKAWQEEWHRELHEKGLPTMREAIESGMTLAQWIEMLENADGLSMTLDGILTNK